MNAAARKIIRRRAEWSHAVDRLAWLLLTKPGCWSERAIQQALKLRTRSLARAAMQHSIRTGKATAAGRWLGELSIQPRADRRGVAQ